MLICAKQEREVLNWICNKLNKSFTNELEYPKIVKSALNSVRSLSDAEHSEQSVSAFNILFEFLEFLKLFRISISKL